jgi:hypothetical protein
MYVLTQCDHVNGNTLRPGSRVGATEKWEPAGNSDHKDLPPTHQTSSESQVVIWAAMLLVPSVGYIWRTDSSPRMVTSGISQMYLQRRLYSSLKQPKARAGKHFPY